MITTATPRRRAGQRIASALWGLLVIGAGVTMAVAFSGYDIDLELAAIIALTAVGGWLVLSAALSSIGRSREVRAATAPVVEETLAGVDTTLADVDTTVHEAVAATAPMPTAPSEATPTEVIFTDTEATDASPSASGVKDTDPAHTDGDEPEAKRD